MGSHDASQGAGGGDSTALGRQMGSCCGTHLRVGVRGPFAVQAALESRGCPGPSARDSRIQQRLLLEGTLLKLLCVIPCASGDSTWETEQNTPKAATTGRHTCHLCLAPPPRAASV